jgi:hypothetical protein
LFAQRHYIAVAETLREIRPAAYTGNDLFAAAERKAAWDTWLNTVEAFESLFKARGAFKPERFLRACGAID